MIFSLPASVPPAVSASALIHRHLVSTSSSCACRSWIFSKVVWFAATRAWISCRQLEITCIPPVICAAFPLTQSRHHRAPPAVFAPRRSLPPAPPEFSRSRDKPPPPRQYHRPVPSVPLEDFRDRGLSLGLIDMPVFPAKSAVFRLLPVVRSKRLPPLLIPASPSVRFLFPSPGSAGPVHLSPFSPLRRFLQFFLQSFQRGFRLRRRASSISWIFAEVGSGTDAASGDFLYTADCKA